MPLTRNLLALDATKDAYARATHHPFLRAAGQLTLSSPALAAWLTQDRLYALCGYGAFLGLLIARLPAPEAGPGDAHSQQHRRRLTVLAGAMANIDREVGFFEQVAQDNGLDLATQSLDSSADNQSLGLANPITRGYIDYMIAVAARGTFEEALVLLWAMEKLYLDAWTYAAGLLSADAAASSSAAKAGAPRALLALIPNWSAHAFVNFVDDIAALVDELEVEKQAGMHSRLVDVWKTVLWYEERFWRAGGGDV